MTLECVRLSPRWLDPLADFFSALSAAGDEREFHPHPLTSQAAEQLCKYEGRDLYYIMADGMRVLAYGMLRGWDEGYDVPSLGIAVHPDERGRGIARVMMEFLHAAARRRGAPRVRLKVYAHNEPALRLYRRLGYSFRGAEQGQLVGFFELTPPQSGSSAANARRG